MSERGTAAPDASSWSERFAELVSRAREAPEPGRTERVGELHAMLSLLEARDAAAHAPVLRRLLEEGRLEGLRDANGLASTVAVTRALVALGGLDSLAVSPAHLAALRRWEERQLPSAWGSLALVMIFAFVVQTPFMMFSVDRHGSRVTAAQLSGDPTEEEPAVARWMPDFIRAPSDLAFAVQSVGSLVLLVACATVGRRPEGRSRVQRGLLGLGGLGVLVGAALILEQSGAGWGVLISALGSLLSAYLLKET